MTETTADLGESNATGQPTQYEKLRAIPWSLAYDLANTFFVQLTFFGSVFILFLDELGLNESQIGVLLSILPFLSLLSLFITSPVALPSGGVAMSTATPRRARWRAVCRT